MTQNLVTLPDDFGPDARNKAKRCPFSLEPRATNCDLVPGDVVYGSNNGIETIFPDGKTIRMVLFGFTKPLGYACCIDHKGKWWNTHPEALSKRTPMLTHRG